MAILQRAYKQCSSCISSFRRDCIGSLGHGFRVREYYEVYLQTDYLGGTHG